MDISEIITGTITVGSVGYIEDKDCYIASVKQDGKTIMEAKGIHYGVPNGEALFLAEFVKNSIEAAIESGYTHQESLQILHSIKLDLDRYKIECESLKKKLELAENKKCSLIEALKNIFK